MIQNPILKGFNPDPAIIRIKDDFYIATSTFEWWPGVCIYHSKDLKNWELHSHPLNRPSQLNLKGVDDCGGIWAPCLSYDGEKVYLVYTNVRVHRGIMKVTENYLVTCDDIDSREWSEPVYLNSLGFDPSMFHDDDGKKWLVSLDNHYREGKKFNGLFIQEYNPKEKSLVGEIRRIYRDKNNELVEGTHVVKHDGMYYLLKAQGGTGVKHSEQVSRSESLFGPYEDDKEIFLHSRNDDDLYLQCAGHGGLVDTPNGELYFVHLCRRLSDDGRHSTYLGRETAIQKVEWKDGWLRLSMGGNNPFVEVEEPKLDECKLPKHSTCYDFKTAKDIDLDFQSVRGPMPYAPKLTDKGLVLRGCDGLNSRFDQELMARRIDCRDVIVETKVDFNPSCEKTMAGLVLFYNTSHWYYLCVTRDNESKKRQVCLMTCDFREIVYDEFKLFDIPDDGDVILRAHVKGDDVTFSFVNNGVEVEAGVRSMELLADEHINSAYMGAMAGISVQDMYLKKAEATFEYFNYLPQNI